MDCFAATRGLDGQSAGKLAQLFGRYDRLLCRGLYFGSGSGVPVGRLELPTYRPQPRSAGAEKLWAAALKSKQLLAAVRLQQLYFETGHWQRDFLIDPMTARGRNCFGRRSAVEVLISNINFPALALLLS
jgi:hypothetical protein